MSTNEGGKMPAFPKKRVLDLLHALAREIESACISATDSDYCVEIVAKDARQLLRRYYKLRASLTARQKGAK